MVTLLNLHKPRDRTHHEQFRAFHMSFYRAVEATSVTPFASRALDRALAATLVAGARHVEAGFTHDDAAGTLETHPHALEAVRGALEAKLGLSELTEAERTAVLDRLDALIAAWGEIAAVQTRSGDDFRFGSHAPPQRLLQEPLKPLATDPDPRRAWFAAGRSMRETEPSALLLPRRPDGSAFKATP
ncbi:hypothetical protein [Rubellimicrobium roseum]|uniref:hypothetical protein n=1 Tax=Rubellimicrobium roseum TaxID=687525 RepID=UPI00159BEA7A|nr:hypothetical protein [Rubellimicrobium roseum]